MNKIINKGWPQSLRLIILGAMSLTAAGPMLHGEEAKAKFDVIAKLKSAKYVSKDATAAFKTVENKKVFGLYFTAKWCGPCKSFTPELVSFREKHKDNFEFIMASRDTDLTQQNQYLKKTKMNVAALRFDDPLVVNLMKHYKVRGIPTLMIFNAQGELVTTRGRAHLSSLMSDKEKYAIGHITSGADWLKMIKSKQTAFLAEKHGAAPTLSQSGELNEKLYKDTYIVKNGVVEKCVENIFSKKKLYVVCSMDESTSVDMMEKLNKWHAKNKKSFPHTQLYMASRDATKEKVDKFVLSGKLNFPFMDAKIYKESFVDRSPDPHFFYTDADEGTPRFRFYKANGSEIYPDKSLIPSRYDSKYISDKLTDIIKRLGGE